MVRAFEFLSYDELLIVVLLALFLVLGNLWTFIRDSFAHTSQASIHLSAHPLDPVASIASRAVAAAVFPHAGRASARPLWRRRRLPQVGQTGARRMKPRQA